MADALQRPSRRPVRGLVAGIGMAAVLAASLPVNWTFLAGPASPPEPGTFVEEWLRGGRTAEVTRLYNDGFLLKDVGIDLFGVVGWTLFGEGRPGVLVGSDGWLFSVEEFETDGGSRERLALAVKRIGAVRDDLAARGVGLLVALVPAKARIHPERLGGLAWPPEPAGRLAAAGEALAGAGVEFVDLSGPMAALAAREPAFLATDTHWTPAGAGAAAAALAGRLAGRADLGPSADFALSPGTPGIHRGDLMRFIRLGPLEGILGPDPDRITPLVASGGPDDLLGEAEIPVALVGTSYSADARWSFEAQLKAALGRDVLNMAEEGRGPFEPMQAFIASGLLAEAPPRLVVWEIPERYLDDPLATAAEGGR